MIRPLTPEEEAARAIYRQRDADKVAAMRKTREASRRHYEWITWPAMQWEIRRREINAYVSGCSGDDDADVNASQASRWMLAPESPKPQLRS